MTTLEDIERKWGRKAKAAASTWLSELRAGTSLDAMVKGLAAISGMPSEGEIRASLPVSEWDRARSRVTAEDFLAGLDKAISLHKWKRKYAAAYTRRPRA